MPSDCKYYGAICCPGNNNCIQWWNDNNNCGGCGIKCGANQTCQPNDPSNYSKGASCKSNQPSCTSQCDPSKNPTLCVNSGTEQVCYDTNGDGCYEWANQPCGKNQQCIASVCQNIRIPASGYWCEGTNNTYYGYWFGASWYRSGSCSSGQTTICTPDGAGLKWEGCQWPVSTNQPPAVPAAPAGPSSGYVDTSYRFSVSTTDPDGDNVRYTIDWGDGTFDTASGYLPSGQRYEANHAWVTAGTYQVTVRACDQKEDLCSNWSAVTSIILNNLPLQTQIENSPAEKVSLPAGMGWCSVDTLQKYFSSNADNASRVCWAESRGEPTAGDDSGYIGLFQIGMAETGLSKEYLQIPENNIKKAVEMSSGGTDWRKWSVSYTYTCYGTEYISLLGIYSGCIPWQQGGSATGYNCSACL